MKIDSVRCQVKFPRGVHIGQSEGRRAAFPRTLADSADDAIKDRVPVEFLIEGTEQAGVPLRNAFFKFVRGGNPAVEWPNLNEGQHTWLWKYPTPVARTRDNFAVIMLAGGGQTVTLACTPEASAKAGGAGANGAEPVSATVQTAVKLH